MKVRIVLSCAAMVAMGTGWGAGAEEAAVDPAPQQLWWDRVQEPPPAPWGAADG